MDEHEKEMYRRIIKWFKGRKQNPFKIDIELHRRCNLRCLSCSRRASPDYERLNEISKSLEMPLERWLEIVDECKELGALMFNIEGINEPFFHPKLLLPVMKRVKAVGMFGILTTNGVLINDRLARFIVEIGWDRLHVSIHSHKPEVHDRLVGKKGAFKKAKRAVELINKWKKKLKSTKPMLNLNVCVNKLNFKHLPQLVKFAKKLGFEYIFTEPLMIYHEKAKELKLNAAERKQLSLYVKKAKELEISNEDLIATVTMFTAKSIALSYKEFLPEIPNEIIIGGGGAYNKTLMKMLREELKESKILVHEDFGIPSQAKEPLIMTILGNEVIHLHFNNIPNATGAKRKVIMGKVIFP